MKTFFLLWRLVCYKPWLYIVIILEGIVFYMAPLVFGLILQMFFNELPVNSQFDSSLSILIGFLLLAALVQAIVSLIGTQAIMAYTFSIPAFFHPNLSQLILIK